MLHATITKLILFVLLCLSSFTALASIPIKSDEDRVKAYKYVKPLLDESHLPDDLKKKISSKSILGYEKRYPFRYILYRDRNYIVTLHKSYKYGKEIAVNESIRYAKRHSSKDALSALKKLKAANEKLILENEELIKSGRWIEMS